jgi:hypothetical protein
VTSNRFECGLLDKVCKKLGILLEK